MASSASRLRQSSFKTLSRVFESKFNLTTLPSTRVSAGTTLFRFVPTSLSSTIDYFGLFKQQPPAEGRGQRSLANRWSGMRADGITPGVAGSYWGSLDGITSEGFFYSVMHGYDPATGPRRILPSMTPLIVNGANTRQDFFADENSPKVIPFSCNYNVNIVIAKVVNDFLVVDLDFSRANVKDFNERISRTLRTELDQLGFKDFQAAVSDDEFRDLARLFANSAASNGYEGLSSLSVRRDGLSAEAYSPGKASTLVIWGNDQAPLTDKLVGTGVIEIRPDQTTGASASLKPITVFRPQQEYGLVVAGPDTAGVSSASEAAVVDGSDSGSSKS